MKGKNDTEKRYLFDPYRVEFTGVVRLVEKIDGEISAVYLDRTYFYPESGGQPSDRGEIGGFEVLDILEDEKGVRHIVGGKLEEGLEVRCRVDWERRFDHMQQHSGQHLISRLFEDRFGFRTVSFHLGKRTSTIDLDTPDVAADMLWEIEKSANEVVWKAVPIRVELMDRSEFLRRVEEEEAYAKLRSKLPDGEEEVRVVEIVGMDLSTCCGTHCSSTAGIGVVKLLGTERVKGRVRVEFVCGGRALSDYAEKSRVLDELSALFSNEWREVPRLAAKLMDENRELRKRNEALMKETARRRAESLTASGVMVGEYEVVRSVFDEMELSEMKGSAFALRDGGKRIVLFAAKAPRTNIVFACTKGAPFDMGSLMRACMDEFGGKGGGGRDFAQGGGVDADRLEDLIDGAEEILRKGQGE